MYLKASKNVVVCNKLTTQNGSKYPCFVVFFKSACLFIQKKKVLRELPVSQSEQYSLVWVSEMANVLKHQSFLTLLSRSKRKKQRNLIIELAKEEELRAIIECIINVLYGNINLNKNQHKKLKRYKKSMRKVAQGPMTKKKSILKQEGGFLGSLIPIALSALGTLFPNTK